MKHITTEYIKSLRPCQNRLNNWIKHYPKFKGTLTQFLNLKNITYKDKVWVYMKTINPNYLPLVAADLAETVLYLYEKCYPDDDRPRKAIEAARSEDKEKLNDANTITTANAHTYYAYAARAAAYAVYAAYNTTYAAVYAADVAYAVYDAEVVYAVHVANAVDVAYAVIKNAERAQLDILKKWARK